MPFLLIIVGILLVVAALNNAHGDLAAALKTDLPGFFKWGAAIAAILGLGFLPGLKTPSRWLLGLVLLVIVLKNHTGILAGFADFAKTGSSATDAGANAPTPSDPFSASGGLSTTPASDALVSGDTAQAAASASATSSGGSGSSGSGFNPLKIIGGLLTNPGGTAAGLVSSVEHAFGLGG